MRASPRWALVGLCACSEYGIECRRDTDPVTRAEARVADDCESALCIDEIMPSNHTLVHLRGGAACPCEEGTRCLPLEDACDDDYLILRNTTSDDVHLDEYTVIRDDITEHHAPLVDGLVLPEEPDHPAWTTLDLPDEHGALVFLDPARAEVSDVVPGNGRVLLFAESRTGRPDSPAWVLGHDLGAEWGTVRLAWNGDCEVDLVYYGDLSPVSGPDPRLDPDRFPNAASFDVAYRRVTRGCADGVEACWKVACPSLLGEAWCAP